MESATILAKLPKRKIPLSGKRGKGLCTLVDGDYDGEYFAGFTWYVNPSGYVVRTNDKHNGYLFLHQEVARAPKGLVTDHINRNKLDNRSCNLRWATPAQNGANSKMRHHMNPYRGVVQSRQWRTNVAGERYLYTSPYYRVLLNKKRLKQRFTDPEEAARAYDKEAKKLWGDFAVLNFP